MKIHAAVPIIIGLALILSTPVVLKTACAQVRMGPSVPNPMMSASGIVGNNAETDRNSAIQGVTEALSSLHGSSGVGTIPFQPVATHGGERAINAALIAGIGFIIASFYKFHQHKQNPQIK